MPSEKKQTPFIATKQQCNNELLAKSGVAMISSKENTSQKRHDFASHDSTMGIFLDAKDYNVLPLDSIYLWQVGIGSGWGCSCFRPAKVQLNPKTFVSQQAVFHYLKSYLFTWPGWMKSDRTISTCSTLPPVELGREICSFIKKQLGQTGRFYHLDSRPAVDSTLALSGLNPSHPPLPGMVSCWQFWFQKHMPVPRHW